MKYGIATVAALAILAGVGAWFYTNQDEPKAEEATGSEGSEATGEAAENESTTEAPQE